MQRNWQDLSNWQDFIELPLGAWIIVSPFVLGFLNTGSAGIAAILIGTLMITMALFALGVPDYWEEWSNLILGLLLVISPWLLGYSAAMVATSNAVICGALMILLSVLGLNREWYFHRHPDARP